MFAVLLLAQIVIGVLYTLMFQHINQHDRSMAAMLTQVKRCCQYLEIAARQDITNTCFSILKRYFYDFHSCLTSIWFQASVQNRRRKNAITAACEAYGFLIETTMNVVWMLTGTLSYKNNRANAMIFWQVEFPLLATVQAMTNSHTRQLFMANMRAIFRPVTAPYKLLSRRCRSSI